MTQITPSQQPPPYSPAGAHTRYAYNRGDGGVSREYFSKVDLIPLPSGTLRGIVASVVPVDHFVPFVDGVNDLKLLHVFHMRMRKIQSLDHQVFTKWWMMFKIRQCAAHDKHKLTPGEAFQHLRVLLKYLEDTMRLTIIWKEDDHGYEISQQGDIRRRWKLEPF